MFGAAVAQFLYTEKVGGSIPSTPTTHKLTKSSLQNSCFYAGFLNVMETQKLKEILKNIPHQPGVYRYYGLDGNLLYIGKAKDLKNRVSQYFQDKADHTTRIRLMVTQVERIEYSIVHSETEAIILEANLIHAHQPRYNILLKDDRNYLYVRLTTDPIPTFLLTRRKYDPASKYFGPFTKRFAINDTLRTLRILFPFCGVRVPNGKPCNYVGIHQCDGICIGKETFAQYNVKLNCIQEALNGRIELAEEFLTSKIMEAINLTNFELAALWRDKLKLLQGATSNQKIILPQPQDIDLLTLVLTQDSEGLQIGSFYIQSIRGGKIVNVNNFLMSGSEEKEDGFENEIPELEQEDSLTVAQNPNLAESFLQRFLVNYSYKNSDNVPIMTEVFEDSNVETI